MPLPTTHVNPPEPMDKDERMRLRAAAFRIQRMIPGPIGQQVGEDLLFLEEVGYVFAGGTKAKAFLEACETLQVDYAGPARDDHAAQAALQDQINLIISDWLDTQLSRTGVPTNPVSVWEKAQRKLLENLRRGPLANYTDKLTPRIVQLLMKNTKAAA